MERVDGEAGSRTRGAVFLDRDGVINEDRDYVGAIADFVFMPGVPETIRWLNELGFLVFVVTNQSGVARGMFGEDAVRALHDHMQAELAAAGAHVDDVRYCPHHPEAANPAYRARCACRKPAPGMILDLMAAWPVDPARSIMIGDRERDVASGRAAGIDGVLIRPGERLEEVVRAFVARVGGPVAA